MSTKPRTGDIVQIRVRVEWRDVNSSIVVVALPPYATGPGRFALRDDQVAKIEPVFIKGDRVEWREGGAADPVCGKIVALSPEGCDPPQAWVKVDGRWPLATKVLSELTRVDP